MKIDDMVKELAMELLECSAEEIKNIQKDWIYTLKKQGKPESIISLCNAIVDKILELKVVEEC